MRDSRNTCSRLPVNKKLPQRAYKLKHVDLIILIPTPPLRGENYSISYSIFKELNHRIAITQVPLWPTIPSSLLIGDGQGNMSC